MSPVKCATILVVIPLVIGLSCCALRSVSDRSTEYEFASDFGNMFLLDYRHRHGSWPKDLSDYKAYCLSFDPPQLTWIELYDRFRPRLIVDTITASELRGRIVYPSGHSVRISSHASGDLDTVFKRNPKARW